MLRDPSQKYRPFPQIDLPDRQWPSRTITRAPRWLSTDMRDGNQALVDPMDAEKKTRFFDLLVKVGVREIEIGFPAAGATEFDFISGLVKSGRIPDDVIVQVLTQSREDLIRTSFDSLRGARAAIAHLYNAVSPAWRRIVFQMEPAEIREIAVTGAKMLRDEAAKQPDTDWHFEYSPETFSTAELDFSLECCSAVMDILKPTPERPIIFNLPATVEAATPNIYADQIEYFGRNIPNRESVVISLHTHNDRGTGVAATELGLLAGADRVEGCLFGNGERTGNCDLVTVALNMYTQGVDPELDFSDIDGIAKTVEYCNQLPVHPRHPYAGELVFTAFSGSHQDAINKGFKAMKASNRPLWEVPYLPIDPMDLGRSYEAVVRINSQSGKGGVAYILETEHGIDLPRRLQIEFSKVVQAIADGEGVELSAERLWRSFEGEYLDGNGRFGFIEHKAKSDHGDQEMTAKISDDGKHKTIHGHGNGPVDGFVDAMRKESGLAFDVADYREHAMGHGANAAAIAYVELRLADGSTLFGVGIDKNIVVASLKAVVSGVNRALKR